MTPIDKVNQSGKILAIDPSANHLSYTVAEIDIDAKRFTITVVGMIWTKSSWTKGRRFSYMYKGLKHIIKEENPDVLYTEAFFTNPKMKMGSLVVPVVNGLLEMICYEVNPEMRCEYVSPASWRKTLGITPDTKCGKRDYKAPTKRKVEELVGKLPDTIISNITGKHRALPTDLPDSMAIACAMSFENKIKVIDLSKNLEYNYKYTDILKENIDD